MQCCVLSGRGLSDVPIPPPEESYQLWCWAVQLYKYVPGITNIGNTLLEDKKYLHPFRVCNKSEVHRLLSFPYSYYRERFRIFDLS